MIIEDLLNTDPENKARDRAKDFRSVNDPPEVLNYLSDPRVTLGGGAVT